MTTITLTWSEVRIAALVGCQRHVEALSRQLQNRQRADDDGWRIHIEGAAGEMAAARALGMYWPMTVNTFRSAGDVGRIEVRTRSRADYQLIIRDDDRDQAPFVLVRGQIPTFDVVGWTYGGHGKRPEWLRAYGGREAAYFIPDAALRALELLPLKGNGR